VSKSVGAGTADSTTTTSVSFTSTSGKIVGSLKAGRWVGAPVDASADGRVASGVDASQATNNTVKISNNIRTDSFITIPQYENHLFIRLSPL
jgi:hypothetical protein